MRKVFLNLRPKSLEGQALSGTMLAELADCYVQAINSDAVPTITTAWERVIDAELARVFDAACQSFNQQLQPAVDKFPLDEQVLRDLVRKARGRARALLGSSTVASAPPERLAQLRAEFEERAEEAAEVALENNRASSERDCEDLLARLHEKVREKLPEYRSFR